MDKTRHCNCENRIIGKVTPEQRDEIQALFERRNALKELFLMLSPENEFLYDKLVLDMAQTQQKFSQWWEDRSREYNWESDENGEWNIDFQTCEISILCKDE